MPAPTSLRQLWDNPQQGNTALAEPDPEVLCFIESMRQKCSPGSRVLDAGCGRGRYAPVWQALGFTVYGCDISLAAIQLAQTRSHLRQLALRYEVADLRHLPYGKHSFRLALCTRVLPYHFKADMLSSLHELWRVLEPDGWLYLDLLDRYDSEYGMGQEVEPMTFLDTAGMPTHFSSGSEIKAALRGFAIERMQRLEQAGESHTRAIWTIWARKITTKR